MKKLRRICLSYSTLIISLTLTHFLADHFFGLNGLEKFINRIPYYLVAVIWHDNFFKGANQ